MKISTKTRYAIRLLIEIGIRMEKEKYVSISDISEKQAISERYAEQILLTLKNAGILGSRRGIGGGFYLAKTAEDISVYDVYKTLDGEPDLVDCLSTDFNCVRFGECASKYVWADANQAIIDVFKKHTLKTLIEKQKKLTAINGDAKKWLGSYI